MKYTINGKDFDFHKDIKENTKVRFSSMSFLSIHSTIHNPSHDMICCAKSQIEKT